ncbi:phosphatidate cytidylyltransferase [Desulfitispora alkaliphila]|uniref:phosphatidate cytidylyltransferase n=1 Tax=Desulfitispora alkaliphila TaxID=622674 RepID=UPI003D253674
MLWKRILSAVVGIPVVLYVIYQGELPFLAFVMLASVIGMREYSNILVNSQVKLDGSDFKLLYFSAVLMPLAAFFSIEVLFAAFISLIGLILIKGILSYPDQDMNKTGTIAMGIIYPSLLISFLVLLRQIPEVGVEYIILVLVVTWASDTGAYFTGMSLGRSKLAPKLSPKKTIEGAIGGVIAAVLAVIVMNMFTFSFHLAIAIAIGGLGSVAAQLGDLYESMLKRIAGIKDSGNVIPGHGGVLDRLDSLLLVAPVIYYMLVLI